MDALARSIDLDGDPPRAPGRPQAAVQRGDRRVIVSGLDLIGSIGIYEHEKRYEQRILVSIELLVTDDYDGQSDRITDVYDYDEAVAAVKTTVGAGHVNLLETLAERIADACLANAVVRRVIVRIEKPDVLPSCRAVGIEIERTRG